jgi:hypothetical protein
METPYLASRRSAKARDKQKDNSFCLRIVEGAE